MTEQETREKIVGIISNDHCLFPRQIDCKGCKYEEMATDCDAFRLADALISAGIGDVKEVKMAATRYEMLYNMQARDMALTERKAYNAKHRAEVAEHRAEVAERAFKELCIDKIFGQNDEPSIKWTWDFYKARAEKELAEEEE